MESKPFRGARRRDSRAERSSIEVRVSQRASGRVGEHELIPAARGAVEMRAALVAQEAGEPHCSACVRLRWTEHEFASDLGEALDDVDGSAKQIKVSNPERRYLTRS